jgi:UDPglucose 6-dehydrogenase
MKKITVVGTGYVGLVTGICLAEVGHNVLCLDIDEEKVKKLNNSISPIYEPGIEELISKNIQRNTIKFTSCEKEAYAHGDVIYIAVGTPSNIDGTANLKFVETVAKRLALNIKENKIVVTKSTVPVGTNEKIKQIIEENLMGDIKIEIVSNPEFLREGSALVDAFHGDRIVIGTENEESASVMEEINKPFNIPIFKTDIRSAEMIKYASNAFLATKISFINEIANICEKISADVEDVAIGMGMDQRIGNQFLKAGIGYGGSCFPKDTDALVQIAGNVHHDFDLLRSVIEVNNKQRESLVDKATKRLGSMTGKKVSVLGLAFKPNTDDMREAAALPIVNALVNQGAEVFAYDPVATENAKKELPEKVNFVQSIEEAITGSDCAFILTDWNEIKDYPLDNYSKHMSSPVIFDGRNCYDLNLVKEYKLEYHSVGRRSVENTQKNLKEFSQ